MAPDQPTCQAIVHLWSLDAPPPEETTVTSLETAQTLGCGSVLQLVQELARVERHHFPRLWLITRGAQPAGEETLPPECSAGASLGIGSGDRAGAPDVLGWTDGPGTQGFAVTRMPLISCGMKSPFQTERIRLRSDKGGDTSAVWCANLNPPSQQAPLKWRTDGSYLITGGLGDLGLSVARWMVEQGARRLILLGRTQLPPRAQWNSAEPGSRLANQIAAIREMEALGASRASGLGRCGG